ncbi:MAG: hypothetical protein RLZZ298_2485 [Pseudomonadota bacterium]|jgi:hypothetical protein
MFIEVVQPMRFFQPWRAVNIYIDAIERYGIDSNQISPDLSGRVCKHTCDFFKSNNKTEGLTFRIQRSAALVAMCILGPDEFRKFQHDRHDISLETIAKAASNFKQGGQYAASLDLKIIHAVADSGNISRSFACVFSKLLTAN